MVTESKTTDSTPENAGDGNDSTSRRPTAPLGVFPHSVTGSGRDGRDNAEQDDRDICDYCGGFIEHADQRCPALDLGRCQP